MNGDQIQMELKCPYCSTTEQCGYSQMLKRLQSVGVLRRSKDPEPTLVQELFESTAARLTCLKCERVGMIVREAARDDWDEWNQVVTCGGCRETIPRERLEIFPGIKLCAACQQKEEAGANDESEYCPRCGEIMTVRLKSGTSRYFMSCPSCGSR
ncbi:MAG: TraR/DksA C4-type zinc finger protein [Planctomycetaceae bacterium]|nr:TraR/DksA C4-type zinc finger protein [Planctomycetales bacterium]MCB9923308.1 TraR/DksA C4-type zinc finger protein [Planctomycetaceae bacterium]